MCNNYQNTEQLQTLEGFHIKPHTGKPNPAVVAKAVVSQPAWHKMAFAVAAPEQR